MENILKKLIINFILFNILTINFCNSASNNNDENVTQLQSEKDWLKPCSKKAPNEGNCFKNFFEGIFPYLATGIPALGIEPFEPLLIHSVTVSRGNGNLQLTGGFRDLVVKGPSNATVKSARLDLDKNILNFDLVLPKLDIDAIYTLNGNILLLPLVGNGDVQMTLKDVRTSVKTTISLKKLPEEVIKIDNMKVTFLVGNMKINLNNLFNGNKVLGSTINLFLNQNSNEVISELREDLESGLGIIFTNIWNSVFTKIPIKYWLV